MVGILSPECRPKSLKIYNAATGPELDKLARINIYPDGRILWAGGQQEDAFLCFDGISFPTQPYKAPRLGKGTREMSEQSTIELGAEDADDDQGNELDDAEEL